LSSSKIPQNPEAMTTQDAADIPLSSGHKQQAFKLLELPPELLALLESDNPPTLYIKSAPSSSATTPAYAILNSGEKNHHIRQKNTSSPIMIIQPSSTGPTKSDDPATFISVPSICCIASIEDTLELVPQDSETAAAAAAPLKVNKWHEKFAKGRTNTKAKD